MDTFNFKQYISEGGIEQRLLISEIGEHFDTFIEEALKMEPLEENQIVDLPMTAAGYSRGETYNTEKYGEVKIIDQIDGDDIPPAYGRFRIEKVNEEKEQLNELEPVATTIGLVLSAPKIIALIGKLIKGAVKAFRLIKGKTGEKQVGDNKVSGALENTSKKLHSLYIKGIMKAVKFLGFASKVWKDPKTGEINEDRLKLTAEIILLAAIGIAAFYSFTGGLEAASAGHPIVAALEGGLTTLKGSEITDIVKTVGPKLAKSAGLA